MKIAAAYDGNGGIFQHFGRTEQFKVYEIENGQVISSEIIDTNGVGHEALAEFLADRDVAAMICGGMGQGAQDALADAGITVFSGVTGSADEAIDLFLKGELTSEGVNCDHHDEEEGGCEGGCGGGCGGCGGGCGGCGGCGEMQILYEGPNAGKKVRVHYTGTFDDGTKFDSSYDRGEPLEFICGVGMMIPGFDKAVVNMVPGQTMDIHLMPEDAYGMPDPTAILKLEIAKLPGSENLNIGQMVYLTNPMGQQFPVRVIAKTETEITFDANHEMAGKELNFKVELLEVEE